MRCAADAPDARQRADDGRGDGPPSRGSRPCRDHQRRAVTTSARTTVICGLRPGQKLRIVKYLAYGWSSQRSRPGAARPGRGRVAQRTLQRMAGSGRRAAQDSRRLLGQRRCRGRGRPGVPASGAVRALPPDTGECASRTARHRQQGPDRHRIRRPHLLGHRGIRPAGADLHHAARGRRRIALARFDFGFGEGARRRSWTSRAPAIPGERSAARNARPTGRPAPPRGTSTPTSPWLSSATGLSPATSRWRRTAGWRCSSRRPGCGIHSDTTTATVYGTSTGSPVPTNTPRSCGTTCSPT